MNHDMNHSETDSQEQSGEKNSYKDLYRIVLKCAPSILKDVENKEVVEKMETLLVDPYQYYVDNQEALEQNEDEKSPLEEKLKDKNKMQEFQNTIEQ